MNREISRKNKLMTRIIATVAALALIVGVLYGIYELLDSAKGEEYYIDMSEISDTPVTESVALD